MRPLFECLLVTALCAATGGRALAAWPTDPLVNLPVDRSPGIQAYPQAVPDGMGGAFVHYRDYGGAPGEPWAVTHLLGSGIVDPAWPVGGVGLLGITTSLPDHEGGVVLCGSRVYRLTADGSVWPGWPADGLVLPFPSIPLFIRNSRYMVPSGTDGIIVVGIENISSPPMLLGQRVYVQRVLLSGVFDPAWPTGGRTVAEGPRDGIIHFEGVNVVTDDAGGAIVTWGDTEAPAGEYARMQRVRSDGSLDPSWPGSGRIVPTDGTPSTDPFDKIPRPMSDGAGGAYVVRNVDVSSGTSRVVAQHVTGGGVVDWAPAGITLFERTDGSIVSGYPFAVAAAGELCVQVESRNAAGIQNVVSRIRRSTGAPAPGWPAGGLLVRNHPAPVEPEEGEFVCTLDPSGGVYLATVVDGGPATLNIEARHVLANGIIDPIWPAGGLTVSGAEKNQDLPTICLDPTGGFIAAWRDYRSGSVAPLGDIFAQRVDGFGYLGDPAPALTLPPIADVPGDEGGFARVSWSASSAEDCSGCLAALSTGRANAPAAVDLPGYFIYRQRISTIPGVPDGPWQLIDSLSAAGTPSYQRDIPTFEDGPADGSITPWMRVRVEYWTALRDSAAPHWNSAVGQVYSLDNIAPDDPASLKATYLAGQQANRLSWRRFDSADLSRIEIHRSHDSGFVPSPADRVATLAPQLTTWTDPAGSPFYYKLIAWDDAGNPSSIGNFPIPTGFVGVDPTPLAFSLAVPSPNPASRSTSLSFTLPVAGDASLVLFDASGRALRTLASGEHAAGVHSATWDLHAADGRSVAPGLYFARLACAGRETIRRIVVTN